MRTVAQLNAEQESLILRLTMWTLQKVVNELTRNMKMDCKTPNQNPETELAFEVILLYATMVHKRQT